jgi:DNA-binding transcriptional ArsR family regulator
MIWAYIMNVLAEILSSKIRAEIFRLLFGTSAEELHMREIERRSGYAIGTIQTELKKLLRLYLVKKRKDGNRLYYRANKEHPLYPDIRSVVLKTIGLVDILKNALRQDSDISIAFVFGSINEKQTGNTSSLRCSKHLKSL